MGNLSQFLDSGGASLKMVGGDTGSVSFSTTGPRLTITPAAVQKVVLVGSMPSQMNAAIEITLNGVTVYSGDAYDFFSSGASVVGGMGEQLIISVTASSAYNFTYVYQLLEEE